MQNVLIAIQVVLALMAVVSILIQEKNSGMGEAIGGAGAANFQTTKRGAEKLVGRASFVLILCFLVVSIILNFV